MLTDQYARVPVGTITIPLDRQRRVVDTKGLVDSIREIGVINPIIVRLGAEGVVLVAGERRLTACRELGHTTIPARWVEDLNPVELQILELEENLKRKDLSWQDMISGVARIHGLLSLQADSEGASWSMDATAEKLGLGPRTGAVPMYLKVHSSMGDPRIAGCDTVREAYNLIARREQRLAGEALQELLDDDAPQAGPAALPTQPEGVFDPDVPFGSLPSTLVQTGPGIFERASGDLPIYKALLPRPSAPPMPQAPEAILHESFIHWAPKYSGQKFNLIHCDFPYGINAFAGKQGSKAHFQENQEPYDDSESTFFSLLDCLLTHLDKLLSVSGHLVFWYSGKHARAIEDKFRSGAPSLVFQPYPLIWIKSDNAGVVSDTQRGPRHVYETALMATRGDRRIVKITSDAYSCPTDRKLHPSAKPEPMLRHFLSMLVDGNTRMLDPTCGSGSALRACEGLGGTALGLEIDGDTCGLARTALRNSRNLRRLPPQGNSLL